MPKLVGKPFATLAKAVGEVPAHPSDDELHGIRKKAKRARYAAEAAEPVVGRPAERLARNLKKLQDVLGDHQDAVVAEAWLREAAAEAPPEQAMAAGLLISRQRSQADQLGEKWRRVWADAAAKKVSGWLA
jgi:CHAD domain-containing protein